MDLNLESWEGEWNTKGNLRNHVLITRVPKKKIKPTETQPWKCIGFSSYANMLAKNDPQIQVYPAEKARLARAFFSDSQLWVVVQYPAVYMPYCPWERYWKLPSWALVHQFSKLEILISYLMLQIGYNLGYNFFFFNPNLFAGNIHPSVQSPDPLIHPSIHPSRSR